MSKGELILYATEDGRAEIQLRASGGTVWLTQAGMARLFETTPQSITQLVRKIYGDRELAESATCKESLQVRLEGVRQVRRVVKHYNLDMILAVGYRVRSARGSHDVLDTAELCATRRRRTGEIEKLAAVMRKAIGG